MDDFKEDMLRLISINLSDKIIENNVKLRNKNITVFNSSILPVKDTDNILIASRGWYGNIRSWDGINFIILSLFTKDFEIISQKILDIDPEIFSSKISFQDFKKKVISHGDKILDGPEDPRLFYFNNEIYLLVNDLNREKHRHMYISKVDIDNMEDYDRIELCKQLSTTFEKNWGTFIYKEKLHLLYDINPLKIFELEDNFKCKMKFNINDKLINIFSNTFPDIKFHIRNSTNLIPLNDNEFLGLGHGVLDYKNSTDINKYLIPLLKSSKYSNSDKEYFDMFFKLYTGFFYKLNMEQEFSYVLIVN